jgi:hypothetical protein
MKNFMGTVKLKHCQRNIFLIGVLDTYVEAGILTKEIIYGGFFKKDIYVYKNVENMKASTYNNEDNLEERIMEVIQPYIYENWDSHMKDNALVDEGEYIKVEDLIMLKRKRLL